MYAVSIVPTKIT